jgi:pyruvate,water dikinase
METIPPVLLKATFGSSTAGQTRGWQGRSPKDPKTRPDSPSPRPDLLDLADEDAVDRALAGAKAANLARARRAGLPVLPGLVLSTAWDHDGWSHPARAEQSPARTAWTRLGGGDRALVVRSSSTGEDGDASSMAGVFESVLDVTSWTDFVAAVDRVIDSGDRAGTPDGRMAVLVQPQLSPRWGGVLFAADPVTGRTDRLLLAAVEGGPDRLVSGLDEGWTALLSPRGRVVEQRGGAELPLGRAALRQLAALGAAASEAFGSPQDIEWAIDDDGVLWLLQSRPITTPIGIPRGPVLGAGPIAETFPEPLGRLESDLWLTPLREGVEQALRLTGTASGRALRRSAVVRDIDGWAVADLHQLGVVPPRHRMLRKLDPRPPARRLRAAWRTGRLARALPALARDIVEQVDRDLADVPGPDDLSNRELLAVLANGQIALRALHGHEALAGMLIPQGDDATTAASLALSALAEAHATGLGPDDIFEAHPIVLALVPPSVGGDPTFPAPPPDPAAGPAPGARPQVPASDDAVVREALRLRARWVHELMARAAWTLGDRLTSVGVLPDRTSVRLLALDELRAAVETRFLPADLDGRVDPAVVRPRPLPARFRLTVDGTPLALVDGSGDTGVGAGGGVASGPVHLGDDPPTGAVLVVAHLDPRLAPIVGRLAGLVAETGSPLSHLAILAREHGVATVVGHAGATERYAPREVVEVDGSTGAVRTVAAPTAPDHAADHGQRHPRTVIDLTARAADRTEPDDDPPVDPRRSTVIPMGGPR